MVSFQIKNPNFDQILDGLGMENDVISYDHFEKFYGHLV
jgi:hypothetical protein